MPALLLPKLPVRHVIELQHLAGVYIPFMLFRVRDGVSLVIWLQLLPEHPDESDKQRLWWNILFQKPFSRHQTLAEWGSLPSAVEIRDMKSVPVPEIARTNLIGLKPLIQLGALTPGNDGEVFLVEGMAGKRKLTGVWADSEGAAIQFHNDQVERNWSTIQKEGLPKSDFLVAAPVRV